MKWTIDQVKEMFQKIIEINESMNLKIFGIGENDNIEKPDYVALINVDTDKIYYIFSSVEDYYLEMSAFSYVIEDFTSDELHGYEL